MPRILQTLLAFLIATTVLASGQAARAGEHKAEGPGTLDIGYNLGLHFGLFDHRSPTMSTAESLLSHGFRVEYTYRLLSYLLLGGAIGYAEYSADENISLDSDGGKRSVEHRILSFPLTVVAAADLLPDSKRFGLTPFLQIGYQAVDYQVMWDNGALQDSASTLLLGGGIGFKAWVWKSLTVHLSARYDWSAVPIGFGSADGWRYHDPGDPSAIYIAAGMGWTL